MRQSNLQLHEEIRQSLALAGASVASEVHLGHHNAVAGGVGQEGVWDPHGVNDDDALGGQELAVLGGVGLPDATSVDEEGAGLGQGRHALYNSLIHGRFNGLPAF